MSLDRSLKSANSLVRHRNVLTRGERLDQLKDEEKWDEKKSVYGLPKVGHRKAAIVKTVKAEAVEGAVPAAGAAAPAAAPAGKGAPAKAAPAKGAAPAAPATGKGAGAPAGKKK